MIMKHDGENKHEDNSKQVYKHDHEYSMVSMRMMMEYGDVRRKAQLGLDWEHTSGLLAI